MSVKELTEKDLAERAITGSREANTILKRIAIEHGVRVGDILGRERHAHFMRARRALYESLRAVGWGYAAIAEFCGNRDHSTVKKVLTGRSRKKQKPHWLGAPGPYVDGLFAVCKIPVRGHPFTDFMMAASARTQEAIHELQDRMAKSRETSC